MTIARITGETEDCQCKVFAPMKMGMPVFGDSDELSGTEHESHLENTK